MRKLPHARSVSDVREDESGGKAVCDPEQRVVPFLPQTSRHGPMPLAVPACLPRERLHADASQDAAQGPPERGGQTGRGGRGSARRRLAPWGGSAFGVLQLCQEEDPQAEVECRLCKTCILSLSAMPDDSKGRSVERILCDGFPLWRESHARGRLAIIQRKKLCQFCFRHPENRPCPSQLQPACPIRGCM